jgi:hypothetical protein
MADDDKLDKQFHAPATTPKAKKAKPLPAKVKIALDAMLSGEAKSMAAAARIAKCSRQYIFQQLDKRPDIIAWIQNRAARTLGLGAAQAAVRMLELIHSDSSRTAFESSRFVLGLSGFRVATDRTSTSTSPRRTQGQVLFWIFAAGAIADHYQRVSRSRQAPPAPPLPTIRPP